MYSVVTWGVLRPAASLRAPSVVPCVFPQPDSSQIRSVCTCAGFRHVHCGPEGDKTAYRLRRPVLRASGRAGERASAASMCSPRRARRRQGTGPGPRKMFGTLLNRANLGLLRRPEDLSWPQRSAAGLKRVTACLQHLHLSTEMPAVADSWHGDTVRARRRLAGLCSA